MKKLLSAILMSALCLDLFAVGAAADDAAPPVEELTVWHIYGEGDAMHDGAAAVIADAEAEFGIKINVVTEETEAYKVKCSSAAAGHTLPDIFCKYVKDPSSSR